jgi:DNA polymerase I-like protein with 3'-5' exonuclease and polymerase domains
MTTYIFDLESDGLLDKITKIHCLSYASPTGDKVKTATTYEGMRQVLKEAKSLIGHNIIRFDVVALEKILKVKIKHKLYDTLAMSWVFNPDRPKHGLDSFFPDYGIKKPEITDWEGLTLQQYVHRCEQDVLINQQLWLDLIKRANFIYKDKANLDRFLQYLTFKMRCAAKQEELGWRIDKDLVEQSIVTLKQQQEEKVEELTNVMPLQKVYSTKKMPKVMTKKDGTLSTLGEKWYELLEEEGLPKTHSADIKVLKELKQANPNSSDQVKDWLYSLGWEPCTFDYKKDDAGNERKVPQVRKEGELTNSVKLLIDKDPAVEVLDGLTVIQHRLSIFEGLLESEVNGKVFAGIDGFTNTLRFKHKKPLVNLPGVDKPWGKQIRGALIANQGEVLCGADMVSLESTTKRHYIYPYDPEYVAEMSQEGFDEHLDLAVKAGHLAPDDYAFYIRSDEDTVNDKERFTKIKKKRKKFKPVNYSAVYGVGELKLSRTTGMSKSEAKEMLEAYWSRNWAVLKFSKDQAKGVRTINGKMWIQNPVSGFWYSLRYKKDIFSTLNQSTGVYCFDTWIAYYTAKRPDMVGQFHDETINPVKIGDEQLHESTLRWAIGKTNEKLKLNIDLDIDVQFGSTYAHIH